MDTGPELASSSSAAADKEIQLTATDERAVGKVEDSEMDDGHNEAKRARTIGGMGRPATGPFLRTFPSTFSKTTLLLKTYVQRLRN